MRKATDEPNPGLCVRDVRPIMGGACGLTEVEVRSPRLPGSFDGFTLVQLTDLHLRRFTRFHQALVEFITAEDPDVWAFTGDLVEQADLLEDARPIIEAMKARHGVFGVCGNNEHATFEGSAAAHGALSHLGIHDLDNTAVPLRIGDERIWLVGTDDPSWWRDDLDTALTGVPPSEFRILLAHSPDILHAAAERGIDLLIMGHTHGGQMCLPGIGALIAGTKRPHLGRRYAAGPVAVGTMSAYVCRGLGTSRIHLRTWCRPEIVRYTLRLA